MGFLSGQGLLLGRVLIAAALCIVMLAPAWWLAGRLQHADPGEPEEEDTRPFFRLLCAVALGVVGYLTFVNLAGRVLQQSTLPATAYIVLSAVAAVILLRARPAEMSVAPLLASWRAWLGWVAVAFVLGLPQWILAVSTPYWDEVASSAIHLTAANQFAEGVFPPRHNALPDIVIKYHYGFTILSGSVRWLTGLSANVAVDIASTGLWLFTFLFIVFWLRSLGFARVAALWGGGTALLGGGLTWLYLRKVEVYSGFAVAPGPSALQHQYSDTLPVVSNLLRSVQAPSAYLRNGDGSLSNLPWDIAAQFQQHAVALGLPLALFALYLLVTWIRATTWRTPLLVAAILTFGVVLLGHAVFGGVAAVTAGVVLLTLWMRAPTRAGFIEGLIFGGGVAVTALLHGGLLAMGAQYGSSAEVLTLRDSFGYHRGGIAGFINWNVAGFGVPLLMALAAWVFAWRERRGRDRRRRPSREQAVPAPRQLVFFVVTVLALFSYFVPQFAYYTSESSGVEQFTEISKFFFTAHLGFALVSAFGVASLVPRLHWGVLAPAALAMVVTPLTFTYFHSTTAFNGAAEHEWLGFYRAPYHRNSVEQQMGEKLRSIKHGPRDTYFDASGDERARGYLNEMLVWGGSVFTLTPSRYERTGSGYRLAGDVVAERLVQNGRMARLRPGAAEECDCRWLYSRPTRDWAYAPLIVRARFDKLVTEGYVTEHLALQPRSLYGIERPTADLDSGIHAWWRPRIVSQARSDWDGDGRNDLAFFDYVRQQVIVGSTTVELPPVVRDEMPVPLIGRFPGDRRADLLVGRLRDTEFRLGRRIEDVVEQSNWGWSYRASATGTWEPEYERWAWTGDVPFLADLTGEGFDSHVMFRPRSGEWFAAPARKLEGPVLEAQRHQPLPFAGRFLRGSRADLAVWGQATGTWVIRSVAGGAPVEFQWGGGFPRDVNVSGDYTGDGYDEVAVWNRENQFWYFRTPPDGPITQFRFGTATGVPLPADYNHDGRVDPAYWEPREGRIYVSFSRGQRTDLVVPVPPNSIPIFVQMR